MRFLFVAAVLFLGVHAIAGTTKCSSESWGKASLSCGDTFIATYDSMPECYRAGKTTCPGRCEGASAKCVSESWGKFSLLCGEDFIQTFNSPKECFLAGRDYCP